MRSEHQQTGYCRAYESGKRDNSYRAKTPPREMVSFPTNQNGRCDERNQKHVNGAAADLIEQQLNADLHGPFRQIPERGEFNLLPEILVLVFENHRRGQMGVARPDGVQSRISPFHSDFQSFLPDASSVTGSSASLMRWCRRTREDKRRPRERISTPAV